MTDSRCGCKRPTDKQRIRALLTAHLEARISILAGIVATASASIPSSSLPYPVLNQGSL